MFDCQGNTVIHLDKALARMRQYERMKHKVDASTAGDSDQRDVEPAAASASAVAPPEAADGMQRHCRRRPPVRISFS